MIPALTGILAPHGLATSFESIATKTAAGGESNLSFTSIPSTYAHLQLRMSNIKFTADQDIKVTFNSVGGTSYVEHQLYGSGSGSASAWASGAQGYIDFLYTLVNDADTNTIPSAAIMDILDYADTNKYKTTRILWGGDYNGKGKICLQSGLFMSSNAISTITVQPFSTNFTAGCTFALYGVKA
jgi:hypothetical protein